MSIGTARINYINKIAKIERVAILNEYRGNGIGKELILHILSVLDSNKKIEKIKLSSQIQVIEFYKKLGFRECSGEYIDAGITHIDMELNL